MKINESVVYLAHYGHTDTLIRQMIHDVYNETKQRFAEEPLETFQILAKEWISDEVAGDYVSGSNFSFKLLIMHQMLLIRIRTICFLRRLPSVI